MLISIGNGNHIEVFTFAVKKRPTLNSHYAEEPFSLASVSRGDAVDWGNSRLYPFITVHTEGKVIQDYEITRKGLVYYSKETKYSEIPTANYILFDVPFIDNPILTQDHAILR